MNKPRPVDRRGFLSALGVTVGGTGLAGAGLVAGSQLVEAQTTPPKGRIPDTPYKTGHMTFLTGPAAVLGDPSLKGHILAAEEINAKGGLLGKRKIETVTADEAAGTDANVKELRRMKLEGKIDLFTGIISSGNTPALGPVAEEMSLLTIFVDGCTDFLFDKAVPQPKYTFRITNIQSADGITSAIGAAQAWPQVRKVAHIHPDYSYGRNAAEHFTLALERLLPGTQVVSESWPKLGTTDFTSHITKTMSANPDLLLHLGLGRRLRGLVQAGHPLRAVREDEGRDHAGIRSGTACARQGSPRGRACGRALQLSLHLSRRRPLAHQQGIRAALPQALERISELPVRWSLRHAVHAEGGDREGQPADGRLALG